MFSQHVKNKKSFDNRSCMKLNVIQEKKQAWFVLYEFTHYNFYLSLLFFTHKKIMGNYFLPIQIKDLDKCTQLAPISCVLQVVVCAMVVPNTEMPLLQFVWIIFLFPDR